MAGNTIKWQRGKFINFLSLMKIRVGGQNSIDIMKGDSFEYDGSILKYSGMEIPQPQLRGAIEDGWAVFADSESENVVITTAKPQRNVAKSQTVNRDLNNVQRTVSMETSSYDEDEVLKVGDRSNKQVLKQDDNRKMRINSADSDTQGAVPIGRVRTSAKAVFQDVTTSEATRKLSEIENMSNIRADMYGTNGTITKEGVTVKTNITNVKGSELSQDDEGVLVGKVKKTASSGSDGISISDTSNIREEKKAAEKSAEKAKPKPVKKTQVPLDPRIRIARAFDPDFPDTWIFSGKLADRIQAVRDYGATSQFIQALYAAEGDQMRRKLSEEFPDLVG